ncbi:hypothetical protein Tco_1462024 [Tanacetum coccineum]
MSTYLRHMGGFKHAHLKSKSYEEIQRLFDIEMKRVNSFIPLDLKVVEGSEKRADQSSAKRKGAELEHEVSKKQKIDDEEEMKKHMEIVQNEEELVFDAVPLATKPPVVVNYKIINEGKIRYFQLIRADGSTKRYSSMIQMLQDIDREDLETLWKLVKAKHRNARPEEGHERVLCGDLKVMFKPDIESEVWRNLKDYKVTVWKLFSSSRVHFVRYGSVKNHKKTVKNEQARTRESEEFKKKPKIQSRSPKSQASVKSSQRKANHWCPQINPTTTIEAQMIEEMIG